MVEIALQIIFSQFDEKIGPFALTFYPKDVPIHTQGTVSKMTIDLFTKSRNISNAIAIMSFPELNRKGLIKILEWKDPTRRGGSREATLSIFVKVANFIL